MQKQDTRYSVSRVAGVLTPQERMAILLKTRGSWKRPIKESLRTLATIRRGLNRKIT